MIYEKDFDKIPLGIYRVYWLDGDTSVACIAQNHEGERLIMCSNWTTKLCGGAVSYFWRYADSIEKMELIAVE